MATQCQGKIIKVCWNLSNEGSALFDVGSFFKRVHGHLCQIWCRNYTFFDTFLWGKKKSIRCKSTCPTNTQGSREKPSSSQRNYDSGLLGAEVEVHSVVWHCYRATKTPEWGGRDGWMIQQGVRLGGCLSHFWPNPNSTLKPRALNPQGLNWRHLEKSLRTRSGLNRNRSLPWDTKMHVLVLITLMCVHFSDEFGFNWLF